MDHGWVDLGTLKPWKTKIADKEGPLHLNSTGHLKSSDTIFFSDEALRSLWSHTLQSLWMNGAWDLCKCCPLGDGGKRGPQAVKAE